MEVFQMSILLQAWLQTFTLGMQITAMESKCKDICLQSAS